MKNNNKTNSNETISVSKNKIDDIDYLIKNNGYIEKEALLYIIINNQNILDKKLNEILNQLKK